jgi:hypothetical protein
MSFKIYGKKGKPVKTSESYDTSLVLQTFIKIDGNDYRTLLATGKWNGQVFCLMEDSCIRKNYEAKTYVGGIEIINELLSDNAFIDLDADPDYYILNKDIGVHSPSAAANIVHGNDRNGRDCWEHEGKSINIL